MYIRFFTYVKNEITLIEKWLRHHASITQWYLLHVVDNGSTDGTLELLQHYKNKMGINLYQHGDYTLKGEYLSSLMRKYKSQNSIMLPVDGDEFVAIYKDTKVNNKPEIVKEYIENLPMDRGIYQTYGTLFSLPEKEVNEDPLTDIKKWKWKWNNNKMRKLFYNSKGFKSTDHGNHNGISENKNTHLSNVVLVHYHDTGRESYRLKCEQDIKGLGLNIDVLKSQLAKEGQNKGSNEHFAGVEKVNAYINMNNWRYEPVTTHDVTFNWYDTV